MIQQPSLSWNTPSSLHLANLNHSAQINANRFIWLYVTKWAQQQYIIFKVWPQSYNYPLVIQLQTDLLIYTEIATAATATESLPITLLSRSLTTLSNPAVDILILSFPSLASSTAVSHLLHINTAVLNWSNFWMCGTVTLVTFWNFIIYVWKMKNSKLLASDPWRKKLKLFLKILKHKWSRSCRNYSILGTETALLPTTTAVLKRFIFRLRKLGENICGE